MPGPRHERQPDRSVVGTIPFNNAAERALRGLALGRKSRLFAGSERGAVMYTLIQTAKLSEVDPQAWLADIPRTRLSELLPWNWRPAAPLQTAA